MVKATMAYLQKRKKDNPSFTYELIIVDDGSSDATSQTGLEYH